MLASPKQIAAGSRLNHSLASLLPTSNNHSPPAPGTHFHSRCRLPANQTLHSLLERCSTMRELRQIHAQVVANGLLGVGTVGKLVAFCAVSGAGDLLYARAVFDRVPDPNRFMWNSLIRGYSNSDRPREAIFLHRRMLGGGLLPNEFTLPFVLKSCASESAFEEALGIHALIVKLGFESQVFVQNALLHAYTVCGSIRLAREVFEDIPHRNIVSWNSLISGYSQVGNCEEAFTLFKEMRGFDLDPDEFTLVSLLSVCSQTGSFTLGRLVHHFIEISGSKIDLILGNALVDMYAKCGDLCSAQTCFDRMPERDVVTWTSMVGAHAKHGHLELARCWFNRTPERNVVSWNSLISCYIQHGLCHEALDIYAQMQASKMEPDETTLTCVLAACSQVGDLISGKKIHRYICETNTNPDITLFNSLVDMYAKCGPVDTALELFSSMHKKNVVSWNVIIGGLAMHGCALDAVELFAGMVAEGVPPDEFTFVGVLSACGHGGLLEVGQYYFDAMSNLYSVPRKIEHYACMVDLLGRGGHLGKAVELIRSMPMKPDVVIWGALLGACRIHGNVKVGEQVLKQLLELEPYSGGLYVLVSNMYCEAHRWEDVKNVRKLMKDRGIRKGRATSSIEVGGNICEFMVEDKRHKISRHVYFALDCLTDHLRSLEGQGIFTSMPFFDVED